MAWAKTKAKIKGRYQLWKKRQKRRAAVGGATYLAYKAGARPRHLRPKNIKKGIGAAASAAWGKIPMRQRLSLSRRFGSAAALASKGKKGLLVAGAAGLAGYAVKARKREKQYKKEYKAKPYW